MKHPSQLFYLKLFCCLLLGVMALGLMPQTGVALVGTLPPDQKEIPASDVIVPDLFTTQQQVSSLSLPTLVHDTKATRTVGSGCSYATIAAAVAVSNPGDVLLIEGGVTFNERISIDENLTLQGGYNGCASGSTSSTTINGGGTGAVFGITNAVVTLRNLYITGGVGSTGGGVRVLSNAKVTLYNADVSGNQANYGGGVYISGSGVLTMTNDSDITNNTATVNGGGARVWGRLVSLDTLSDITNNTAPHGGGVSVMGGELLLNDADMSGNRATDPEGQGGAIYLGQDAVATMTGSVWLYNGNQAYDGAAIYADNSQVFLGTSTIGGNQASHWGGGIYLANGSTLSASDAQVGDDASSYGNEALIGAGLYASASAVDFSGSIYNNNADTQGGGIYAESSVITLTDTYVGGTGANQANQVSSGLFGAGLYFSDTLALLSSTVVASNTFSSGAGWGGGIAVWAGSVLTLANNSRVEYHHAPNAGWFGGSGGGVLVYDSAVTLDNSYVLSNTADLGGGGIYMTQASTLNILNGSELCNNHALNGAGGAVWAESTPDINISDAMLRKNSASTDGGAIYIKAGTLNFTGGWTLRENTATDRGGALAVVGTAVVSLKAESYSLVYANQAQGGDGHGGMLYLGNASTAQIHATTDSSVYIYANLANTGGGALYADNGGLFDIYGQVNFDRNRADNGGAIYLVNDSRVWLDDYFDTPPQLWDNRADDGSGGAIYAQDSSRVECDGAVFGKTGEGNQAAVNGGAIYLSGSTFDADNCTFEDNRANEHGGAIAADQSTLDIYASYVPAGFALAPKDLRSSVVAQATNCDPAAGPCSAFFSNVADNDGDDTGDGGAIYTNNSILNTSYIHLHRNSAYSGGAIYQTGSDSAAHVSNSLIYSNTVSYPLGAGIRRSGGAFTVTHVILANNVGGSGFSGYASAVTNTIAWGNEGYPGFARVPDFFLCNIDDGDKAGLVQDPLFMAPGAGEDYHLRAGSPAIDACATGLSLDLDNMMRPYGGAYDMGAYEYALGMAFDSDRSGRVASPGVVTYTHILTNTGGTVDTYTLSVSSSNGWSTTLDPDTPVSLTSWQTTPVVVSLSIPADIVSGTVDTLVITAVSGSDPGLTTSVTDTTRTFINSYFLYLPMTMNDYAP